MGHAIAWILGVYKVARSNGASAWILGVIKIAKNHGACYCMDFGSL